MGQRASVLSACGLALVTACGGSAAPGAAPDAGGDADSLPQLRESACRDWAARLCGALDQCAHAGFVAQYPDLATCRERKTEQCLLVRFAAGSDLAGVDDPRPCLEAQDFSTCTAARRIFRGSVDIPAACGHGKGADGAPCAYAEECAGGVCYAAYNGCGVCGHSIAVGASCASGVCAPGSYCDDTCKKQGEAGASCTGTSQCMGDLACVGGVCSPRLPAGADCGGDDADPCAFDTACDAISNTCIAITTAQPGEACGPVDATTFRNCTPDSGCLHASPTGPGTCVTATQDGEACGNGDVCLAPAGCFMGKCQIVPGAACGYPAP